MTLTHLRTALTLGVLVVFLAAGSTAVAQTINVMKDIRVGSGSSNARLLVTTPTRLCFFAEASALQIELWCGDGTGPGTSDVTSGQTGTAFGRVDEMVAIGETLYFSANRGSTPYGFELWKFENNTLQLVKDIWPNSGNGEPSKLTVFGNKLLFVANDGTNGPEPWVSDGTPGGTFMLKDINPGFVFSNGGGAAIESFGVVDVPGVGLRGYFGADDRNTNDGDPSNDDAAGGNRELWVTDGTIAGTQFLADLNPGPGGTSPQGYTLFNGDMLFTAATDPSIPDLYSYDGTNFTLLDRFSGRPTQFTLTSTDVYFSANGRTTGTLAGLELWRSDGAVAGAVLLEDINVGGIGSNPTDLTILATNILFSAGQNGNPSQLWKFDLGTDQVALVKDINTIGSGSGQIEGLTKFRDKVYFAGSNGINGRELWVTDGTPAGTQQVADLDGVLSGGVGGGNPGSFTVFNGRLYFTAVDATDGFEVFVLDPGATPIPLPLWALVLTGAALALLGQLRSRHRLLRLRKGGADAH